MGYQEAPWLLGVLGDLSRRQGTCEVSEPAQEGAEARKALTRVQEAWGHSRTCGSGGPTGEASGGARIFSHVDLALGGRSPHGAHLKAGDLEEPRQSRRWPASRRLLE